MITLIFIGIGYTALRIYAIFRRDGLEYAKRKAIADAIKVHTESPGIVNLSSKRHLELKDLEAMGIKIKE